MFELWKDVKPRSWCSWFVISLAQSNPNIFQHVFSWEPVCAYAQHQEQMKVKHIWQINEEVKLLLSHFPNWGRFYCLLNTVIKVFLLEGPAGRAAHAQTLLPTWAGLLTDTPHQDTQPCSCHKTPSLSWSRGCYLAAFLCKEDWQRAVDKEKVNAPPVMPLKAAVQCGEDAQGEGKPHFSSTAYRYQDFQTQVSLGISISVYIQYINVKIADSWSHRPGGVLGVCPALFH